MIFRKPYAFLIKNFKKIHVALIFVCAYIFYKHMSTYNFIKEYVNLESYSSFLEPISNYTTLLSYLAIITVIIVATLLLITLRRKGKPWKLYLIIIGEYLITLFAFLMTTNFFSNYDDTTAVAQILVVRDLLQISSFMQYAVFVILFIRATGLDLNKFSFTTDQEFLELDSSDQEEVEVSFEFDKYSIQRQFRKLKRNLGYFYLEHKVLLNICFAVMLVGIIGYSYYYFGIVHKVYHEGQVLRASNYEITINNAYITDKDYRGEVIDGDNFIILDLKVKNNGSNRVMNMDRFHIMNRNYDILSSNLYDREFKDLGKPYSKREFAQGKSYNFLLIFKALDKLPVNKFNLYYQEYNGATTYLRKIRLKLKDLRTIEELPEVLLNQNQEILIGKTKKSMMIDQVQIGTNFPYNYYTCRSDGCYNTTDTAKATGTNHILKIDFTSSDFTGEEFIDFSSSYGKIKYKDGKKTKEIPVTNALDTKILNNSLYLTIPEKVKQSNSIKLEMTVRNHRYTFKLR